MKFKKLGIASLGLISVLAFTACSDGDAKTSGDAADGDAYKDIWEGFTSLQNPHPNGQIDAEGYYTVGTTKIKTKDTYKTIYQSEMDEEKFNYYTNTTANNSQQYCNMVDGLIMNNQYGETYGGIAKAYKFEDLEGGKQKWTFQLKTGVKWVDNATGEEVANVTADDFVAGIEYILNPVHASELEYLVEVIDNAHEYYEAKSDNTVTDSGVTGTENDIPFSSVGIKAVAEDKLEFILTEKTPYFLTNLTYGCFYPVNRDFLDEQGTDFGTSENNILVNGAFRMTKHEDESRIEFTKNDKYYDKNHVYLNKITLSYIDSSAGIDAARKLYENGTIDGFTVQGSDEAGYKKYVTGEDGTHTADDPVDPNCTSVTSLDTFSFYGNFNFNRTYFAYSNDLTEKTAAQKTDTTKAVANKNFRFGFLYGMEVLKYLNYYYPADPVQRLSRTYTAKELAIDSNGKDYVEYVEEVYNRKQGTTGVHLMGVDQTGTVAEKSDPVYNAAKAQQYFEQARTELTAQGCSFPIIIDVVASRDIEQRAAQKAMYDSLEANSNGLVDIRLNVPSTDKLELYWIWAYYNYDFSTSVGWGADYGDPKSFLHTIVETEGDNMAFFGLAGDLTDEQKAMAHEVFGRYTELYNEAVSITDSSRYNERLQKFAEAEYAAIYEEALLVPYYTRSGIYSTVSRTIPHTASKAAYGNNPDKYINLIISENPITKDIRTAVNAAYEANK